MRVDKQQVQQNREDLKKLIKSQRSEISAKQKEINKIQDIYDKKIEDERFQGEVKLMDIQDRNKARLINATLGKEEKLEELKLQQENTRKRILDEEFSLKSKHKEGIRVQNALHSEKSKEIFGQSSEELKDLTFRINNQVKDVKNKSDQVVSDIRHESKLKIDQAAFNNDLKITEAQSGQANAMKRSEQRYQQAVRKNELEHKNMLAEQLFKNDMNFKTKERINKDRTEAMEKHYQELLLGEKKGFEEKYQKMIDSHNQVLDRLKKTFEKEMSSITQSHLKAKESANNKVDDDFYQLLTLEPSIREDEKAYYIEINTPAHEKENFNLTADQRTVKLMFNRRSEERLENENGGVEKSKRSQVITKEFKVSDIVSDKNIRVTYQEGVLSYRLPKA